MTDFPKCHYCENAGRYIDETGKFSCSICPLGLGLDAIRVSDVPVLLRWVRVKIDHAPGFLAEIKQSNADLRQELLSIIGRKPKVPG